MLIYQTHSGGACRASESLVAMPLTDRTGTWAAALAPGLHCAVVESTRIDFTVGEGLTETEGFDLVDANGDDPHWQEVFLRPSQVGGLVVQVACSDRSSDDWARANGTEVPSPPDASARLLGPQLVHDDLDEARRVWTALGGTVTDEDDGLLVSWDGEPLTIAIRRADDRRAVALRFTGTVPRPSDPALGPPVLATA